MRAFAWSLVFLAGCSNEQLVLPVIGTVGDLPPREQTVVIEVSADGALSVAGVGVGDEVDADDPLVAALAVASADSPTVERVTAGRPVTTSQANVLIRADAEAASASIYRIHSACARWSMAHPRVFFEVRHPADSTPGALAWFVPFGMGSTVSPAVRSLRVKVPIGVREVPVDELAECLRAYRADTESGTDLQVEIVARESTVAVLLGVADAVFRAGLKPSISGDVDATSGRIEIVDSTSVIRPTRAPGSDTSMTPARITGGYAGIADWWESYDVREESIEEPEPADK